MITITATVTAPIAKVWEYWTTPHHIENWAFASDDWEARDAENDLSVGGAFKTTMAAKDGSMSFDFGGVYTKIVENKAISYDMDDKRHVDISFEETNNGILITQSFDPENENSEEMQKEGWQAILDNFKKYTENN